MPRRSANPACPRCLGRGAPCLCAEIEPVHARVEIVIVRHAAELRKQTGSARWAALALGCSVIDYAATETPFDGSGLPVEDAWLLFPGAQETLPPATPPRRLVVPDGTWQQARRMVGRVPELRRLPRLSLGLALPSPRLRRPREPEGRSTLEAIADALALCGELGASAQLHALNAAVLARQVRLRGTTGRGQAPG